MGFDAADSGGPRYDDDGDGNGKENGNCDDESIALYFARYVRAKAAKMNLLESDDHFSRLEEEGGRGYDPPRPTGIDRIMKRGLCSPSHRVVELIRDAQKAAEAAAPRDVWGGTTG